MLRELAEGEITPAPVLTLHGWRIIRMDGAAAGAELPFDAVRDKIRDAMEKAAWARAGRGRGAGGARVCWHPHRLG